MNNISQISNEDLELNQANACEAITQEQAIIQPTQLQSIKISRCTNKEDNRPVSEELTWEELKSLLTTFNETIISKGNAPAFIGGYFDGKGRKYKNLLSRTLITIDIDKYNASISDLEAFIDGSLNKYRYIAHSTSRHSETDARIRIILFPNKEIRPSDYQNVVTNFMSIYFLTKIADIPSSTAAAQLMYLPIRTSKEYLPWYKVNDGLEVDIDSFTKAAVLNEALSAANDDNFRPILTKPRCNLSDDEVIDCLTRYDVSGTDFTMWRDVGFALHHQYCGSDKGRELFVDWSLEDTREEYKHTKPVRKNAERQYDSCDNTKGDQITFATIMYRVNELENKARKKDIEKQINELPSSSSEKDIEKIINILASHYSINEAECYLQQIKKNTKWQISSLRNSFQEQQNKLQLSKINEDKLPYYPLDKPLPRAIFVEDKQFKKLPRATYPNFSILLENYGIKIRYNLISKNCDISVPALNYSQDNKDNASLADILSIHKLNGIETRCIESYILKNADLNQYNPIVEFINSAPWDRTSRLNDLYNTIETQPSFPLEMKELLLKKWLISGVAAAQHRGFYSKGVLVFQGDQSLGKTPWFEKLLPPEITQYFIGGCTLDPAERDSVKKAVSHWIVELGELDSTFKKDIARLKAFITNNEDILRLAYAPKESRFSRRTIFCGSVNPVEFLIDSTGNHRFWVVPVIKLDYTHEINMQQLWAEVDELYKSGEQWWLTQEEEAELEIQNQTHFKTSHLEEKFLDQFGLNSYSDEAAQTKGQGVQREWTASDVLVQLNSPVTKSLKDEMVQVLLKLGTKRLSHNKKFLLLLNNKDDSFEGHKEIKNQLPDNVQASDNNKEGNIF